MNWFQLQSDAYKKLVSLGELSKEEAEKECKVYDFLATCDQTDIYNLFDSSAFNEISKAYLRLALKELIDEGTIDEDQGEAIRFRFRLLFDRISSKELLED